MSNGPGSEPSGDNLDNFQRSSLGRNVAYTVASQIANWSLAFVVAVLQPRYLGPSAIGQLRLATSLWLIAQVLIAVGTTRYLTLNVARDRSSGVKLVGPIIMLRLVLFLTTSIGFAIFLAVSDATSEFRWVVALVGISIGFNLVRETFSATFHGLERLSTPVMANLVGRVVRTVLVVTVLLLGGGLVDVVAISTIGGVLATVALFLSLRKLIRIRVRGWSAQVPNIVRGSVGFMYAASALIVYQQIDTVIIAFLVEDEALGWYSTADALFGTLLFPITVLVAPFFPLLGRLFTEDPDELAALVIRTIRSLLVVAIPLGFGASVIAPQLAPLLLGEDFRETGDVLVVLGPVLTLTFGAIMFGTVAQATGRQRFWAMVMAGAIVLTIPLDLIFVRWADRVFSNGAIGGAMAYVVTEAMMVIVGVWKIAPYLATRDTAWRVARNLAAGLIMVAACWPVRDRFLAIPIAVGAASYLIAIFAFRIVTDDEKAMVRDLLGRVGIARDSNSSASESP